MEFKGFKDRSTDYKSSFREEFHSAGFDNAAEAKSSNSDDVNSASREIDRDLKISQSFGGGIQSDQQYTDLPETKSRPFVDRNVGSKMTKPMKSWSTASHENERFSVDGSDVESVESNLSSGISEPARGTEQVFLNTRQNLAAKTEDSKSMNDLSKSSRLTAGDAIEARYRGESTYLPGKIMRVRYDGSYDVLYDDGKRELGIAQDLIRLREIGMVDVMHSGTGSKKSKSLRSIPCTKSSASSRSSVEKNLHDSQIKNGTPIKMKRKGNVHDASGKIARHRYDGTYDITCDDGNEFHGVSRDLIQVQDLKLSDNSPMPTLENEETIAQGEDIKKGNKEGNESAGKCESHGNNDLTVGTAIQAQYRGKSKFYPGKITRRRFDGTYDVLYDDGERELSVAREFIKVASGVDKKRDESEQNDHLKVGDAVEARYRDKNEFYPGKIIRKRFDGTYDVLYDDGERELGMTKELIKKVNRKTVPNTHAKKNVDTVDTASENVCGKSVVLSVGDTVEARYRGKSKFYPGKITRKRFDGTYDILYDDGERELGVAKEMINRLNEKAMPNLNANEAVEIKDDAPNNHIIHEVDLSVGDIVEARYRGKSKFYSGKIIRKRFDGTYDILYDDGEREFGVVKELIKKLSNASNSGVPVIAMMENNEKENDNNTNNGAISFRVGDAVEARYRGKSKFYPGKITRCRFDSTYDILYDDGERELGVAKELIKETINASSSEVPGIVMIKNDDENERVHRQNENNDVEEISLRLGDAVEARYRGKNKFYHGKITRCRFDGTYDILYDDGERELGVTKKLIKKPSDASNSEAPVISMKDNTSINETFSGEDESSGIEEIVLSAGDTVEARYRGKSKFYPGKITRCRVDGTYDILYDDSERELGVAKELIKKVFDKVTSKAPLNGMVVNNTGLKITARHENNEVEDIVLSVGDTVEARYRGKSKFYPGKITRCRFDGTYDILYDDGERELAVAKMLVQKTKVQPNPDCKENKGTCNKNNDASENFSFSLGDVVQARYRGKSTFYPGKIIRKRFNGTYDILYDDGERELTVAKELIKKVNHQSKSHPLKPNSPGSGKRENNSIPDYFKTDIQYPTNSSNDESEKLSIGSAVEAFHGSKEKEDPGKITRCRLDGTNDILFDDGEAEVRVSRDLISKKDNVSRLCAKPKNAAITKLSAKDEAEDSKVELSSKTSRPSLESGNRFKLGTLVEARFNGQGTFYKGKIIKCRYDGSYDIHYDDGDREKAVSKELIRPIRKEIIEGADTSVTGKTEENFNKKSVSDGKMTIPDHNSPIYRPDEISNGMTSQPNHGSYGGHFVVEDRVEARYGGGTKFYPGKIVNVCDEDKKETYDILYDDGDKESKVTSDMIRKIEKTNPGENYKNDFGGKAIFSQSSTNGLVKGQVVEARYRGKGKHFYKGIISRVNGDGSFDIEYDDGDHDARLSLEHIRKLPTTKMPKIGSKIEADFRAQGRYYPGVIVRILEGNKFDIRYDDGDSELGVPLERVKCSDDVDNLSESSRIMKTGSILHAQIKEHGTEWNQCTVIDVRDDGSFDLRFKANI